MSYCFSRSYVKFQGHTALRIIKFDPNWAFPGSNSSLNSSMAMKCCTKLETAKERCPIVFQGHPSNVKVTRDKTAPILTQIGRFRTIGRSQLSNLSDLPCSYLFTFIPTKIKKSQMLLHVASSNRYTHLEKTSALYMNPRLEFRLMQKSFFHSHEHSRCLQTAVYPVVYNDE